MLYNIQSIPTYRIIKKHHWKHKYRLRRIITLIIDIDDKAVDFLALQIINNYLALRTIIGNIKDVV